MGLDIYHFHLTEGANGTPIVIDVTQPQLFKIIPWSRKVTNQYVDFERLLSDHGLAPQEHRLTLHQREMSVAGEFTDHYYFGAANDPDPMNPTGPVLFFTNKRSFFPVKPHLPPAILKKTKRFKVKRYPMADRLDDVVYGKQVGYQRNNVVDVFFAEFRPDWIFAERSYAERIFELTIPEAQQDFRSNFLDNWDDHRSLVIVSW